eukprot:TRINITY_DN3250_c0_g1_i1.p1 TRINITY_DN3250_c0_g1~~TRINITY_DN3250_c0_g1_i1.p1  ORF type:complete len:643 (-),score=146.99 TRINITY_DN3250_c0_g1_i1:45-1751(-)
MDPTEWNLLDGFSASATIMTFFPELVDLENVAHHWDVEQSLASNCSTVLLNAATGEIVPHWVELDMTTADTDRRALLIQPAIRLEDGTRYIVAMRNLRSPTGVPLVSSSAFVALRDNIPTGDPDVEFRRASFEEIFAALALVGFSRNSLQLAWDFTTASFECVTNRMLSARDDALTRLPPGGPQYRITQIDDEYSTNIYRRIQGVVTVPLYMDSPEPGAKLVVDENDRAVYQGVVEVPWTLTIPRSVYGDPKPTRVVHYGHGLLGGQSEVTAGWLQDVSNRYRYIVFGCDWWGMSESDLPEIVRMLANNLSDFYIIPDRTIQGLVNHVYLMKLVMSGLSVDENVKFKNVSVIDPLSRSYYGNSQGAILGGMYMAITPDIENGVLGVGGNPYAILLPRSVDFTQYFAVIKARYPDPLDQILLIGNIVGLLWDRGEASGYMHRTTVNPLPGTIPHRLLMQYGLHDSQVHYLGQYVYGRSVGAKMFVSNRYEQYEKLFGFEFEADTAEVEHSVLQAWDFQRPPCPQENIPPPAEGDTHELVRRTVEAQEQMLFFFETGKIKNYCNGPCIFE